MTNLPTGTVTFLFTDIEGSTGLLQALGDRYPAVLDEHAAILRKAVAEAGGIEVGAGTTTPDWTCTGRPGSPTPPTAGR
jgi:class 3 adenylate cyclase